MLTTYEGFSSKEALAQIEAELKPFLVLMPSWCEHLYVLADYDTKPPNVMSMVTSVEYRTAYLNISPNFFMHSMEERRRMLFHEVFHCIHGSIISLVRERIIPIIRGYNQDLSVFVEETFKCSVEDATQQFTYAVEKLYAGQN